MPLLTVLTSDGVEKIANYKYVGGDYTPLDNILNPFWLYLVDFLPMWLAPNLVTILGFTPLAAVYIVCWWIDPTGTQAMPSYVLLSGSAALFFYQTMDALDGKQARRTKSSSPLGQLMDHGCDGLALLSHHAMALAICTMGGTKLCILGLSGLQTSFFMALWVEYHTGVLQTSAGPVGVTETQYGLICTLLLAGLCGPEKLTSIMRSPLLDFAGETWQVSDVVVIGWVMFTLFLIVTCFGRIWPTCVKNRTLSCALQQLLPIVVLNALALAWPFEARHNLLKPILLVIGLHFFYLTAQIIIFSMAHQPFPVAQKSPLFLAGLVATSYAVPLRFMLPVIACYTIAFGVFLCSWVYSAGEQITSRLQIRVFQISPSKTS